MYIPHLKPITEKRLRQLESNRNSKAYREWKDTILQRDGNRCQYPGCNSSEKLQVHHIRTFSVNRHLRTQLFNGITLCAKHHTQITGIEEQYEEMFFKLIKEKYYNDDKKDKKDT